MMISFFFSFFKSPAEKRNAWLTNRYNMYIYNIDESFVFFSPCYSKPPTLVYKLWDCCPPATKNNQQQQQPWPGSCTSLAYTVV
jgi:hypothetical protein